MNDRLPPEDHREWLNRAKSNLIRAKHRLPGVYLEDLCFDAQQAVEKALKALLIYLGVRFPRLHDIRGLLNLVEKAGLPIPDDVKKAAALSDYAVESRYPGPAEPVSEEEYFQAVSIAEHIVEWVRGKLKNDSQEK